MVAQRLKGLPVMRETCVRSLGWEDSLEKEMAIDSNILAWKIPWTEEPGGLQSTGLQRVGHDQVTSLHFTSCLFPRGKLRTVQPLILKETWRPVVSKTLHLFVGCVRSDFCNMNISRSYFKKLNIKYQNDGK